MFLSKNIFSNGCHGNEILAVTTLQQKIEDDHERFHIMHIKNVHEVYIIFTFI